MRFFRRSSYEALRAKLYGMNWAVSPAIKKNFRALPQASEQNLTDAISSIYQPQDESDLQDHLYRRLNDDRNFVVPWINAARTLDGADVLEIGCGTGSSTVALAEQGAKVTGVDVDDKALEVARIRCQLYGLPVDLLNGNAADLARHVAGRQFDIVIFFASLEHMSLSERLESMRYSWEITRSGGAWIVNETPNRLWYYDGHTSLENFFHWLTDDLAILWAHRSRRTSFADAFPPGSNDRKIEFARWGRGVSFHEFDLAIGDTRKIDVISNRHDFLRAHVPAMLLSSLVSKGRRYERFLERLQPEIDKAFFREYLNIAIRKP